MLKTEDLLLKTKKFEEDYELILKMRETKTAPVDKMGLKKCIENTEKIDFNTFKYQSLVSLLLSAQTKDEITYECTNNLIQYGLTIKNILKTKEDKINELIKKCGFHNNKAKYIKKLTNILNEEYKGNVPEDYNLIIKLPGIGKKMGILFMKEVLNKNVGIGVDTHVHKISNRLGWIDTNSPEKTENELQEIVPIKYWKNLNIELVGFGQEICKSLNPLCEEKCLLKDKCPYYNEKIKNKKKSKSKKKIISKRRKIDYES